jgi:hypothetical protein
MFRRLRKLFTVLFALSLIVFAGVPLLVSTGWIRGKVEQSIAGGLNRPVAIDGLSFWWFSGLTVKGLSVGGGEFSVDRVAADPTLGELLSGTKDLGVVHVRGVRLRVVKRDDGSYAIPAFNGLRDKPAAAEPKGEPARLRLTVDLRQLTIEMADERGALLGTFECPKIELAMDTGGGGGPMEVTASAAGLLQSAAITMGKDGALTAKAVMDADLVPLGRILPTGTARRLRSTVEFRKEGGRIALTLTDTSADHGLAFSPDLQDEATITAKLTGDLDAGWVRLEEPAGIRAGPLALSVTGDLRKGAAGTWDGGFTGKLAGALPRPSDDVTASGRVEGELSVAMKDGGLDLAAAVRLHDLVFATPGSPEVREKLVTIEAKAGRTAGGPFTIGKAELRGEGVTLALLEPNGQGGLLTGRGLLNRLRPFMPRVDWDSAGRFDLSARLTRGVEGTSLSDIRLNTVFLNISGSAEFGESVSRLKLAASGNLSRLPKGLLPEKFAAEGTFAAGPVDVTMGEGGLAAAGSVEFRDFAVGGSARLSRAALAFSVSKTGDTTRLSEVRFTSDRASALAAGTLVGRRFDGTLDAKGDLSVVPPSMLPQGAVATGPFEMRLALAGATGDLSISGSDLRLARPEEEPITVGQVRFTGRPSWREGAEYPLLADGRLECGNVRMRDYHVTAGTVAPVTFAEGVLNAPTGDFAVNGGTVTLRECTVDIRGEKPVWSLRYDVSNLTVAKRMEPEAKDLTPIFGGASGLTGLLGTKGLIGDRGGTEGLAGDVGFALNKGVIQGSPILTGILTWLRRETQLSFTEIAGQLRIGGGKIATTGGPLRIVTDDFTIFLDGFTDLAGPIDYHARVKFHEGTDDDTRWRRALKDGIIPMRVSGTLDRPSLAPPALDKLAEGVLDELFKKGVGGGLDRLLPGRK